MIKLRLLPRFCSCTRLFSFVLLPSVTREKQSAYRPPETLNRIVLKELSVLWDQAMRSIGALITHMGPKQVAQAFALINAKEDA
jgi:hypothetical protein